MEMNRELNFALNFGKANADLRNALQRAIDELKTITHSGAKFLLADEKVQEIRLMIDNLESMKKSHNHKFESRHMQNTHGY